MPADKIIANSFERVRILRENITYREKAIDIEVDGNINVRNAALLAKAGANVFVLVFQHLQTRRAPHRSAAQIS